MGPNKIIITHNLLAQLWSSPLFWEAAPAWEDRREGAEKALDRAEQLGGVAVLKYLPTYKNWVQEIIDCYTENPQKLQQLTNYILKNRSRKNEQVCITDPNSKVCITLGAN